MLDDDGIDVTDEGTDLVNLIANAGLSLIGSPGMTLDQVMDTNYEGGADTRTSRRR